VDCVPDKAQLPGYTLYIKKGRLEPTSLTKIIRKFKEKDRKLPNFLKMRIFFSKLANYSPILTTIFSF